MSTLPNKLTTVMASLAAGSIAAQGTVDLEYQFAAAELAARNRVIALIIAKGGR